jgi:hypothetical protein
MNRSDGHPLDDHFLSDMCKLKSARTKRASSWDRTGGNFDWIDINGSQTATLADIHGPGCIRHVYFTIGSFDRYFLRTMVLRMYWDDERTPSMEVPIGDLFGLGFCIPRYFGSLLVTVNPGADKFGTIGLNTYFLMPFAERALITLENCGPAPGGPVWYHIDYEQFDAPPVNAGRFHAQWRRENPCAAVQLPGVQNLDGMENYVILDAKGRGNYVGMFLNVDNICGGWYGEGDDMIFIDADTWPPSMHGTGTEEIFGGGACPNTEYAGPYTGFHLVSNKDFAGKQSMYRFHVTDPVRFDESIRVTIEHGHANDLGNDYSSTAFWYQAEPHAPFPELPSIKGRLPRGDEDEMRHYERELETWSLVSRLGGISEYAKTISHDDQRTIDTHRTALGAAVAQKDYAAAARELEAIETVMAPYLK